MRLVCEDRSDGRKALKTVGAEPTQLIDIAW